MARYLEYELSGGRILSEIKCEGFPEVSDGLGILEISGDADVDTQNYGVVGGRLVRLHETAEERAERERLKRERHETVREKLRGMMYEVFIAILEDDESAMQSLREEYQVLKAYMR